MELPTCILVDIDGTLAQRGSRDPYDFEKCGQDIIRAQVRYVSNLVKRDGQISVIILTGREEKWRTIVEKWLADNEVEYDILLMRALDDHRPDYVIKREIFDAKIRDKYRVFFIMDDRKQVKRMWVRMGLFVFDCNQFDEVF